MNPPGHRSVLKYCSYTHVQSWTNMIAQSVTSLGMVVAVARTSPINALKRIRQLRMSWRQLPSSAPTKAVPGRVLGGFIWWAYIISNNRFMAISILCEGFETALKSRTVLLKSLMKFWNLCWNIEIWNLENQPKCPYFLIYFRFRVHHVSYVYACTLEPSRTASTLALN